MYYDDIFMKDTRPATRVNEYCARILEFCEEDPYLNEEIGKEGERFFTPRPDIHYPTSEDREFAEPRFADYFLFSYSSHHYGVTPLEVFLSQKIPSFNKKDKEIYSDFRSHIYSAFKVLKVITGSHFIAKDLSSDKNYKIRENKATYQMEEGDFIIGRIIPYEEDYALVYHSLFLPKSVSYGVEREWKRMSPKNKKELDPLLLERTFYQARKRKVEDDLEMVEKKLRRKLKKYLGKKAITIRQLRRKIDETTDPIKILKELAEKIDFPTAEEFVGFQELFNLFWNLSPRDEFGGKSPQQKVKESKEGPREKEIVHDLMGYIRSEIDPDKFSSQKDLEKEIERYKNRWLSEPQLELNHKTPWEVILEERKRLGNPRKDFSIKVSITPILKPEAKASLNNITSRDASFVKDAEAFISYFGQNRVKVTSKNRWIPFKHLRIIERNFIYKDSFVFLGKEEKRGEEPRKPYIHFIDKICRVERFIYVDEKGWINVDKPRVKKFSQKSYGEKLFEFFCIWVEKVDWKELQIGDFLYYYCDMYQEHFDAPLHHLQDLKVNEKITPEQLVGKLYVSKKKMIKSREGFAEYLTIGLRTILLDYFKWLGIIKTKEKEIVEGMGEFIIEKFWVTPAGRRLINRMIEYFIEKGRIKISKPSQVT